MLKTLKEWGDEISLLPAGVKMTAATIILFLLGFAVYYGGGNLILSARVAHLESRNTDLSRQAQASMEKAAKAETIAANEVMRAQSLESQLKAVEAKTTQSDEKYKVQSQKSSDLRVTLNRVRTSSPANTGTADLEQRLDARYGQTKRSQ